MAVLGVQLVLSMIMASLLSKISPRMSFARWLLCGKLVRYLPPTEDELRQAAGITSHHSKKNRRDYANGHKKETLTVLKTTQIELESVPVGALDVVQLQFYTDYQWLLDYCLFATVTYTLTECYYVFLQPSHEFNLSMLWCLLAVGFSLKILFSLTAIYFRTEDGGERILCILFGFFFLLVAMGVLIVDENVLDFGLVPAYEAFVEGANQILQSQNLNSSGPATLLTFRICLVFTSAIFGAFLTFPGLRLARMHFDSLKYIGGNPLKSLFLHLNVISPLFVALLWVKPLTKDYLIGKTYYGITLFSNPEVFDVMKIIVVFVFCLSRLAWSRTHFQSHLNMAYEKITLLRKEAGRISSTEIQRMVSSVYSYLCVVVLQYYAPLVLLLFLTFMLKTLGEYSFSETFGISVPSLVKNATDIRRRSVVEEFSEVLPETAEHVLKDASTQVRETIVSLNTLFTAACFRGVLSYFCWWICVAWFCTTAFGLVYYSFLVEN